MKKMIIAVIILAVLAAASMTTFLVVKGKHDKENKAAAELAADYALFDFDSDNITEITFSLVDGDYNAVMTDGKWISTDEDFPMNNSFIQGVCTYMCDLTAEKDYGEADDEKMALYGLDNPAVITASDGSNEYTIYVGNISPTGDTYYVMTGNKSKIYAIDATIGSVFKTERLMLKNRFLVDYADGEISEIQVIKNGETMYDITYSVDTGIWNLPEEFSKLTNNGTTASSMVTIMIKLEAEEFFEEELDDYSKYGFDDPYAELIVTGSDGKVNKFLFSYNGNPNSDYIYVLFENSGQVAAYSALDSDFIDYSISDFISPYLCNYSLYNLSSLSVNVNGEERIFNINMEENIIECGNVSLSDTDTDASEAFTNFYNSISYLEISEVDIDASPEKTEPVFSADFKMTDGTDILLELCDTGSDSCYAFINGEYTGAIVSMDSIIKTHSIQEFYSVLSEYLD